LKRVLVSVQTVIDGQKAGDIDGSIDPRVAVERIIGPIWFRTMVLRRPVDDGFVELLVYAVA